MNKSIKIIGDGNCLFRCFSYFLYNSQNFHMKIKKLLFKMLLMIGKIKNYI